MAPASQQRRAMHLESSTSASVPLLLSSLLFLFFSLTYFLRTRYVLETPARLPATQHTHPSQQQKQQHKANRGKITGKLLLEVHVHVHVRRLSLHPPSLVRSLAASNPSASHHISSRPAPLSLFSLSFFYSDLSATGTGFRKKKKAQKYRVPFPSLVSARRRTRVSGCMKARLATSDLVESASEHQTPTPTPDTVCSRADHPTTPAALCRVFPCLPYCVAPCSKTRPNVASGRMFLLL